MGKSIVAIIPARGGSKGVKDKNIRPLNGKPLIAYTIEQAKKSKYIDRIIVSTDDENIALVSKQYGAEVPFVRPDELSGDEVGSTEVILHAIQYLKEHEGIEYDYTCILQCTTPFKTNEDIDCTIEKCIEDNNVDAAVSICEAEVNPLWTVKLEGGFIADFIEGGNSVSARQELPKAYRLNGGIYIIDTKKFLQSENLLPEQTAAYIMESLKSVDIDTEYDFKLCEFIAKELIV